MGDQNFDIEIHSTTDLAAVDETQAKINALTAEYNALLIKLSDAEGVLRDSLLGNDGSEQAQRAIVTAENAVEKLNLKIVQTTEKLSDLRGEQLAQLEKLPAQQQAISDLTLSYQQSAEAEKAAGEAARQQAVDAEIAAAAMKDQADAADRAAISNWGVAQNAEAIGTKTAEASGVASMALSGVGFAQALVLAHGRRLIHWAWEWGEAAGRYIFNSTDWEKLQKDIEKNEEALRKVVDKIGEIKAGYDEWLAKELAIEGSLENVLKKMEAIEAAEDKAAKRRTDIRSAKDENSREDVKLAEDKGEITHEEAAKRRAKLDSARAEGEHQDKMDGIAREFGASAARQVTISQDSAKQAGILTREGQRPELAAELKKLEDATQAAIDARTKALEKQKVADDVYVNAAGGEEMSPEMAAQRDRVHAENQRGVDAAGQQVREAVAARSQFNQQFPDIKRMDTDFAGRSPEAKKQVEEEFQHMEERKKAAQKQLDKDKELSAAEARKQAELRKDAETEVEKHGIESDTTKKKADDEINKAREKDQKAEASDRKHSLEGDKRDKRDELGDLKSQEKAGKADVKGEDHQTVEAIRDLSKTLNKKSGSDQKEAADLKKAVEMLEHGASDQQRKQIAQMLQRYEQSASQAQKQQIESIEKLLATSTKSVELLKKTSEKTAQLEAEIKTLESQINQATSH